MRALVVSSLVLMIAAAPGGFAPEAKASGGRAALRSGRAIGSKIIAPLRKIRLPRRRGVSFLAEGTMARAYVSGDGQSVMKRIKPELHGFQRLTEAGRIELARRQVEGMDILRDAGFPVPAARVALQFPGTIIQDRVTEGLQIDELSPPARREARRNLSTATLRAWRVLWPRGFRGWVDAAPANVRFDADGTIVSWFDPIYAITMPRAIWMAVVRKPIYGLMKWGPERSTPWGPDDL